MIPVLASLILNRADLLQRMIDSIDFPVGRLVIVNNGTESLHELKIPGCVQSWDEKVGQGNIGCAGGWNYCLNDAFNVHKADYLLLCGNDIEWAPGDLGRMHQTVLDFPEADFVFGNHSFSNFLVKRSGFEKVGWADEGFLWAYWEDGDLFRRLNLSGCKTVGATGLHAKHEGSATIKSSAEMRAKNESSFPRNQAYYERKWGGGAGKEIFTSPFNDPTIPVNSWKLTENRKNHPFYRSNGGH